MSKPFGIIYKATNLINGKCYIGQTTLTLRGRINEHKKAAKVNKYPSIVFHKAIRKHGIENFKWEILCECDSKNILNIRETMKIIVEHSYISEGMGYNLTYGGEGTFGYKHTNDTKEKIRCRNKGKEAWNKGKTNIYSDETRKQMSISQGKRKHSSETKTKMSSQRKGKSKSDETKMKMSIAATERWRVYNSVEVI